MRSTHSRRGSKNEDSPLKTVTFVAIWKRLVVWFISNMHLMVVFGVLTMVSTGFSSFADAKYYGLAISLYFALTGVSLLMGCDKALFGTSRIRITPFTDFARKFAVNCVVGILLAKTIPLIVCRRIASLSWDDVNLHPREDVLPAVAIALALLHVERLSLPFPLRDAKETAPSTISTVLKNASIAFKSSVVIAFGVAAFKLIFNFMVRVIVQWSCPSPDSCYYLTIIGSNLPVGTLWSTLYTGWVVSFVTLYTLLMLKDSREVILFHPIDFTKLVPTTTTGLRALFQLTTESEDRHPRRYESEEVLLSALAIGLLLPPQPIFPWQVVLKEPAPTSGAAAAVGRNQSTSSLSSVASSASSGSAGSRHSHSIVESSNRRIQSLDSRGRPVAIQEPFWRVALEVQQQQTLALASTGSYNVLDAPCLPYWGEVDNVVQGLRAPSQVELLWRVLAMQDLHRAALSSKIRRQTLFHQHWSTVVVLLCSVIDATALQLQFLDNYLLEDAKQQEKESLKKSNRSSDDNNSSGVLNEAFKSLTTSTNADGRVVQFSPFMEALQFIDNLQDVYQRMVNPLSWLYGARYLREACGWTIKNRQGEHHRQMIPPLMAQYVVHAVESVTLLLIAALTEDATGLVYHNVPCVVNCLLRLDHALKAYSLAVHQAYSSRFHKQGRVQHIHYRVKSIGHLPETVQSICVAVDDALKDLAESYHDVLKSCDFVDPLYASALQALLAESKQ